MNIRPARLRAAAAFLPLAFAIHPLSAALADCGSPEACSAAAALKFDLSASRPEAAYVQARHGSRAGEEQPPMTGAQRRFAGAIGGAAAGCVGLVIVGGAPLAAAAIFTGGQAVLYACALGGTIGGAAGYRLSKPDPDAR